jgi:hypothetical protein
MSSLLLFIPISKEKIDKDFYLRLANSSQLFLQRPSKLISNFSFPQKDVEVFEPSSCSHYCSGIAWGFILPHKITQKIARDEGEKFILQFTSEEWIQKGLVDFREVRRNMMHYRKVCGHHHICSEAYAMKDYLDLLINPSSTEEEFNRNFSLIMNGDDLDFNKMVQGINKGSIRENKREFSYSFEQMNVGMKFGIVRVNGVINKEACKIIGDELFLESTLRKKDQARNIVADSFSVILVNEKSSLKGASIKNGIPIYEISSSNDPVLSTKICRYQRLAGALHELVIWTPSL